MDFLMVKIAVYTIAKNEEQFVEKWYESAKDADYLFILDTGSTDSTVEKARELGINVEVQLFNPWRFDHARNAALDFLPDDTDMCIALDMDEVLVEGWRSEVEKAISDKVTRPRYEYTWSWKEGGTPGLIYGGDKIHTRHNYRWKHPVHEVLVCQEEEIQGWYNIKIHHYPDPEKSRSQYLPLLELSVKEDPDDDRNAFYYARELFFYGKKKEASEEFKRHLSLKRSVWKPERAASMRYLSKIEDPEYWLLHAVAECPNRREPLVDLANYYYHINNFESCYAFASRALQIKERPLEYICEDYAWGELPYDLAAISAYRLGIFDKAKEYGEKALEINPSDERLFENLEWYNKQR
jgi:glycosyltransferase involved in cell wall biosynthesis